MKKYLKIVALSALILSSAMAANAQATTKYSSRNNDEHIAQVLVTTDSTLTTIDSVQLQTNQTGILDVTVIGYAADTAYSVRGHFEIGFNKRRGTLSLDTQSDQVAIKRDAILAHTNLGGATFSVVAVNNNAYIKVKGVTDTNVPRIRWYSVVKMKSQQTVQ